MFFVPHADGGLETLGAHAVVKAAQDATCGGERRDGQVVQRCGVGCESPTIVGHAGVRAVCFQWAQAR